MISRVADNCFWMSRSLERADTVTRLTDVNQALNLDVALPESEQWRPLLLATSVESELLAKHGRPALADGDKVREFLTWDEDNPCSVATSLRQARENARRVRETISLEMWETVNHTWTWLGTGDTRKLYDRDAPAFYASLRERFLLFHGVTLNTMLHEEPFDFMRLGFALERAAQTARVADIKHHRLGETVSPQETPADAAQWIALLRSCLGIEAFLKRSANVLNGHRVLSFLLFDHSFPHSVAHNVDRARNFLERVRAGSPARIGRRAGSELEQLIRVVKRSDVDRVVASGVHEFLDDVIARVNRVCEAVEADFFSRPAAA